MNELNIDCLILIFDHVDKNSLYSCLLVSKEWCSIVAPILWKKYSPSINPWNYYKSVTESEKKLFNTILSCLPPHSRQILSDNNIKLPPTISPLFNYIRFYGFPDSLMIREIIKMTFGEFNKENHQKILLLEQEIYKLFVSQCKCIKELHWETLQPLSLFPGASTCFSQLYHLYIDIDLVDSDALYEMAQICKDLNKLTIRDCYQDLPGLISLIDAQRNLKVVEIWSDRNTKGTCRELGEALARKSNTISDLYLTLDSDGTIQPSFLASLINLKRLAFYSISYDLQQHLAILEFPDIEHISIRKFSCFKELAMLIEKTRGNILSVNVHIGNRNNDIKNTGMLIKSIANNCPKITSLSTYLDPKDFIHVKSLLLNCRYLKYIHFDSLGLCVDGIGDAGDELLDILTEFLPNSLTEIRISPCWKYSIDTFERFFESCRERTLNYLEFTFHHDNCIIKQLLEDTLYNDIIRYEIY